MTNPQQRYDLLHRLNAFNAKERYWLVRQALGGFTPTEEFVSTVAEEACVPPPSKEARDHMVCAMDYHLNWLYAALTKEATPDAGEPYENLTSDGDDRRQTVENSQEDIDLLIAYTREQNGDPLTQLLLVEAKCAGEFSAGQMRSKLDRLALIVDKARQRGKDGSKRFRFDARLVLMAPCEPKVDLLKQEELQKVSELLPGGKFPFVRLETQPVDLKGFWVVRPSDSDAVERKNSSAEQRRRAWGKWTIARRRDNRSQNPKA